MAADRVNPNSTTSATQTFTQFQPSLPPSPAITSTATTTHASRTREYAPRQAVLHLRGISVGDSSSVAQTEEGESRQGGGDRDGKDGRQRRIRWAESVVDNEGLGRKSSKVCCIYHAPRPQGESSSESSSSSSSEPDSDSGVDDGAAKPSSSGRAKRDLGHGRGRRNHDHHRHHHHHHHGGREKGMDKGKERKRSPNAYEKIPKPRPRVGV